MERLFAKHLKQRREVVAKVIKQYSRERKQNSVHNQLSIQTTLGPLSFLPPGHEVGVPSSETLKSLEDIGCNKIKNSS